MWTKYTFPHNTKNKVLFVSDTHFGHNKPFILEKRGFKTIQEHDETLIERWNRAVSNDDMVVHLGDFMVGAGRDSKIKTEELLRKLNGQKIFLWGNHNAGIKDVYKDIVREEYSNFNNEFSEVYPARSYKYGNLVTFLGYYLLLLVKTDTKTYPVFCSHFAHRIWIDSHKDEVIHLSGHSHGGDKESNPDWKFHKRLDTGIENFGGPIPFDQVLQIMNTKQIQKIDHHDSNTNPSF